MSRSETNRGVVRIDSRRKGEGEEKRRRRRKFLAAAAALHPCLPLLCSSFEFRPPLHPRLPLLCSSFEFQPPASPALRTRSWPYAPAAPAHQALLAILRQTARPAVALSAPALMPRSPVRLVFPIPPLCSQALCSALRTVCSAHLFACVYGCVLCSAFDLMTIVCLVLCFCSCCVSFALNNVCLRLYASCSAFSIISVSH